MSKPTPEKIVYVGAGGDVELINIFPEKDIIFIDSQPITQFGDTYDWKTYRKKFIRNLIDSYKCIGYTQFDMKKCTSLEKVDEVEGFEKIPFYFAHCMYFHNEDGKVSKYYVSSGFPSRMSEELKADIAECKDIILSGFFPDVQIVKWMFREKIRDVYCFSDSSYAFHPVLDEMKGKERVDVKKRLGIIKNRDEVYTDLVCAFYTKDVIPSKYFFVSKYQTVIIECDSIDQIEDLSVAEVISTDYDEERD